MSANLQAVIDVTTNHSTKPASGQVAGYPAQSGRHSRAGGNPVNHKITAQRDSMAVLSATRDSCSSWIPACAGMTRFGAIDRSDSGALAHQLAMMVRKRTLQRIFFVRRIIGLFSWPAVASVVCVAQFIPDASGGTGSHRGCWRNQSAASPDGRCRYLHRQSAAGRIPALGCNRNP